MTKGNGWRTSRVVTPNTCVTIHRGSCDHGLRRSRVGPVFSGHRSSVCVAIAANDCQQNDVVAVVLSLACASRGPVVAKPVLNRSVVSAECSIEVNFSDNYEALHIHVQRAGSRLSGRATYLSDVITGGPDPSMRTEATRESCPTEQTSG